MPSAPLAGRPPFATDDDDSIFTTQPLNTRRVAPPKADNPNNRSSAYDVYDDYLPDKDATSKNPFNTPPTTPASHLRAPKDATADPANRQSGAGGIGMGLLNMDYSDSEDDDDDDDDMPPPKKVVKPQPPAAAAAAAAPPSPSKNAALLAAIGNIDDHTSSKPKPAPATSLSINSSQANGPPGLSAVPDNGNSRSPPPIAAPRPGYAAPVPATFGQNPFEGGIPPPKPIGGVPTPVQQVVQVPPAAYPRDGPPHSPLLSLSPAPLQAPATPIMPVFALPRKATGDKEGGVKFEVGKDPLPRNKSIMRGQSEDPLLPRRGEKGDDFWRRFSMVAREDSAKSGKKESSWLRKTRNGKTGFARWVWVVGLILLLAIVGSIALGVVLSMGKPDEAPKEPTILAGNTSKVAGPDATGGVVVGGGGGAAAGGNARPAGDGPTTSRPVLHVTPTHTIRGLPEETGLLVEVLPTPVPKVLGSVEGLVKQRRNSSEESRGRRRGHRVRRWD